MMCASLSTLGDDGWVITANTFNNKLLGEPPMLRKALLGIAGTALLSTGSVQADSYFGLNATKIDYSESGIDDIDLTAANFRFGTVLSENVAFEVRAGIGIGDDTVNVMGVDVDVELENMFGAYFRFGAPVNEDFYPYAVLGYTRGKLEASAMGFSDSESESDTSFGVGADFTVSDGLVINIEYMNFLDKDDVEVDGLSFGVARSF